MPTKAPYKPMSKSVARRRLVGAASRRDSMKVGAAAAMAQFKAIVLDAWAAGLTYEEIAELSGLSRPRVDQVIREERIRRGIPIASHK